MKEKFRRLGVAFVDGLYDDEEYRRQKSTLTARLESLIIPEIDAAIEAGLLIQDLPQLWAEATLGERHGLLTTILDGVFVDLTNSEQNVVLKPKLVFRHMLESAALPDSPEFSLAK